MMPCACALAGFVTQLRQQLDQLIEAPMHIADEVERAVLVLQVVPERLPDEFNRLDFRQRPEHMNMAKSFALQPAQ